MRVRPQRSNKCFCNTEQGAFDQSEETPGWMENDAKEYDRVQHQSSKGLGLWTEWADQLLERFGFGCCLARLVTGAQDYHSWGFEFGSDVPLQKIWQSNEGEAILSRRRVAVPVTNRTVLPFRGTWFYHHHDSATRSCRRDRDRRKLLQYLSS